MGAPIASDTRYCALVNFAEQEFRHARPYRDGHAAIPWAASSIRGNIGRLSNDVFWYASIVSLQYYISKFRSLTVARRGSHASPHKVCMLLAVMDLVENNIITDNRIYFNDPLIEKFNQHFGMLSTAADQPTAHYPFYYLKSEGFWHHEVVPGSAAVYEALPQSVTRQRLHETVAYAYLDVELFQYLKSSLTREDLKQALFENVDSAGREDLRGAIGGWHRLECELIVRDYIDMLAKEMRGETYSKAAHRRALLPRLNNRSEGSIEYKHQNISAVMLDLGYPYILGYKPAFNYQKLLKDVVSDQVEQNLLVLQNTADTQIETVPDSLPEVEWESVLDSAPDKVPRVIEFDEIRDRRPVKFNYAEREARNRNLGKNGERFVFEYEKRRLSKLGRTDLVQKVEWTSEDRGDGTGYDIRSFKGEEDVELFIEVKTTNSGKFQPFLISDNEVAYSKEASERYSLYRVFEFKQQAKLFTLPGSIEQHVHLLVRQYQATFK